MAGFEATASLDEVGTVLQVGDGIARVYGLTHAEYGELVSFENGIDGMVLNLEEDNVGVVLLGPFKEIKEGDTRCGLGPVLTVWPSVQNNLRDLIEKIATKKKYKKEEIESLLKERNLK